MNTERKPMLTVTVNEATLEVPQGTNVVEAAEMAGQEIPHYCYHPGLSVAGNCRMCLVEVKALSFKQPNPLPKLQIGCNTLVQDGMVVDSRGEDVREAVRGVLELLLVNHPLDCPVCDQAGECKLQEYYMDYGRHKSLVAAHDKTSKLKALEVGPDIMLDQERCILCTRCVRFLDEIASTHELAIIERGDHSRVELVPGSAVDNDYAGNIVDICPVGALTSRDFRFRSRVWFLASSDAVCTGCSTGCNVRVDSRDGSVYRIKPRYNPEVNGHWMCDHGRRLHGEVLGRRLDHSMVRRDGAFVAVEPETAVAEAVAGISRAGKVAIVASAEASVEEGFLAAAISSRVGGGRLIVDSPAVSDVADDGVLVSTDRFPNRAGLLGLGFVESEEIPRDAGAILVLRADPVLGREGWAAVLEEMTSVVAVMSRDSETAAFADQVLAAGSHFEAEASFVNRQGRLQLSHASIAAPAGVLPGWRVLAGLLAGLGGTDYRDFSELSARAAACLGSQGPPRVECEALENSPKAI